MIHDVIYSLLVLTDKLTFFKKTVASVYYIFNSHRCYTDETYHDYVSSWECKMKSS